MAHTDKEIQIVPWRIREGDLVIAWEWGHTTFQQTWAECLGVEKSRGRVTGQRCWEVYFTDPITRTVTKRLVFRGERCWVRRKIG